MDYDYKYKFDKFLMPEEYIVWCGKPSGKIHFSKHDIFLIPFSILWGGFALFWNIGVWTAEAPIMFKIWGLPFLVMGFYFILGRFFFNAYKNKNTFYALTNYRTLILSGKKSMEGQYLKDIKKETLSMTKNGIGTIEFGETSLTKNFYMTQWGQPSVSGFQNIEDCQMVYQKMQSLKHSSKLNYL